MLKPANSAVVLYVTHKVTVINCAFFIESIRHFGGSNKDIQIIVMYDSKADLDLQILDLLGVTTFSFDTAEKYRNFPYSRKVHACAAAEKLSDGILDTLLYFDTEMIAVSDFKSIHLEEEFDVSCRPVMLLNSVGIASEQSPGGYWKRIFSELSVDENKIPFIKAYVDEKEILFYINCEVFVTRPELGIFRKWKRSFNNLLDDKKFVKEYCSEKLSAIFLHQAVLSATILSEIKESQIQWMKNNIVYSHLLHDRMPEAKKISHSREVSILSYDLHYAGKTEIVLRIPLDEQHFDWFINTWCSYLKIQSGVYREDGDCNTVLVETETGFLIIDPSKTYGSNSWLALKFRNQPLEAVLFTHAHHDHWNGIDFWNISDKTSIIIQEKYQHTLDYRNKLENFCKIRNKSFTGGLWKVNNELKFPEPTETFNSDKQMKISNQNVAMINTPAETSDTSLIWFPELKLLCTGDTISSGFPMLGTPRGSYPRFADDYINAINRMLELCPETIIPGHGEPVKGFKVIETRLIKHKEAIAFVDNAVIYGINNSKNVHTIIAEISLPDNLSFPKGFGKISWAIRGLYNNYVGWFDGKLNNIIDTPVSSVYKDLINISGIDPMLELIRNQLSNNNPEKALHLTEIILTVFPDNEEVLQLRKEVCKLLLKDSNNWVESNFIKEELLNIDVTD